MELVGLPLEILAPSALAGLAVLLVLTGKLHTNAEMKRVEKAHVEEIKRIEAAHLRELEDVTHDRGEWRTESRLKDQTIAEQADHISALMTGFEVVKDFLDGLRRAGVGAAVESGDHE